MLNISPALTALIASGTPSIPTTTKSFTFNPRPFIAWIAPRAISSFSPITPLISFGWAVSQFSIRDKPSARDHLAVFFSRTLMSGYNAQHPERRNERRNLQMSDDPTIDEAEKTSRHHAHEQGD